MPTVFSHAIFASAIGKAFASEPVPVRFWILTAICAMLPDADVIAFVLRVNYDSMLGHRGITHSLAFALLLGMVVTLIFFRTTQFAKWKLITYFTAITFSHALLDMLTDGGRGVALLAPVSDARFFFPWRPISVSPIGAGFFSARGAEVILSEIIWTWVPSIFITAIAWLIRRDRR